MTIRDRIPPLTSIPLPNAVDRRLLTRRRPVSELAAPPPGSGLAPVLGDAGAPVIGHALASMRFGIDFALHHYETYGPVSWMGSFGQRFVVLAGPEATQVALVNKDKAFSQEGWKFFIERFFHRGLMLLDFEEHHLHRRIMQEAFTRDRLTGYARQFGPVLRDGIANWGETGRPRLYWALKRLTLDVATRVFMGMRSESGHAARINRAFVDSVRAATALVRFPVPGGRWAAGLAGRRTLEAYFAENLPAKRRANGEDLFSALCHATGEDGEQFSDDDVINHMIFLMMAAHDTTTITSTAAAYHLAKHPEWQERAREESLALGDELPGLAALDELTTLDLVIKESLRLTAPVPSLPRKAVRDVDVLGHYVPAGSFVNVSPNTNHFSPGHWTDPHAFDPERFAEGRREDKSHRYAWMPFGGGAHKCIGLHFGTYEVKAVLHEMLRAYRWSVPEGYRMRWDYVSLPVPVDGLPVRLTRAV
ncbi:cytochrome P450 [Amycolatopsis acidiphila]|uniref:Cytochrome P450 n=1 Tax=Amycolatopsis acidiphila TaxID=715473 RepID=A0A558A1D4_9PSEU|nr:cytochrome P450 [Amycolatopsis acidiphila]TVT18070.1 cytochrome P450 [Amycolatopsis acidiphila]UIJ56641.1 cytochrome P450 [Amycolatopsis acidiphila]GHG56053.1 cytochrome P450 [Amycolatopsis acidiphila]